MREGYEDQSVHVVKSEYRRGESMYSVYCTRCHSMVRGKDRQRNAQWATKSIAVKHAKAHADSHIDGPHWLPNGVVVARIAAVAP